MSSHKQQNGRSISEILDENTVQMLVDKYQLLLQVFNLLR